jgi:hypothetical protein
MAQLAAHVDADGAASPPLISSTASTPGPPSIGVSSSGIAFSWMRVTVPVGSMKIMSSGISVLRIQNEARCGAS